MPTAQAIDFVCNSFFDPTINHPDSSDNVRNIAKNYRIWVRSFTRTGDLYHFLKFLEASSDTRVFSSQSKLGLKTITEAISDFESRYGDELDDRLDIDNLRVGDTYSAYTIHALCGSYDLRSGGILPVHNTYRKAQFVVIKATLNGRQYPNAWLEEGKRLKYFLKAINGNFKETYQDNAAIINNPQNPVLTFVRNDQKGHFTFCGRFFPYAIHTEANGAKWFELTEWTDGLGRLQPLADLESELSADVRNSLMDDPATRMKRLTQAPSKPEKYQATTTVFKRNPDVIAEVLYRSDGTCEACGKGAPFIRKSDATPYLEVHHKIPLSKDGPDTVSNAVALCPNCHRREHFGPAHWPH